MDGSHKYSFSAEAWNDEGELYAVFLFIFIFHRFLSQEINTCLQSYVVTNYIF